MAARKLDPDVLAHLEWLGFVRPTGLVVSAPALVRAGAILDRRDAEGQRLLRACLDGDVAAGTELREPTAPAYGAATQAANVEIPAFRPFAESVLGWSFSPKGYAGTSENPIPPDLEVPLPEYGETLRPDFAVRELEPKDDAPPWQLLIRVLEPGEDFDRIAREGGQLEASARGRMERLLRQTGVPAGLLFNGRALRLISAPKGESSGWLDFQVADLVQTAGRPISTALRLLLNERRLLSLPRSERLAALLDESRKFQNEVSERLAEQVLHALYELLHGFQAAHDTSKGELLRQPLADDPDEVYRALLTVILRLVFLLYAGERDMLPEDETFLQSYSLSALYERLREDAALYPDTMDQRYGAWPQLLVLFRMIHDGAESGSMRLPRRHGVLFDPDRYKFLEGRSAFGTRQTHERVEPPMVPDGTIYRALEKLLVLDGERISYRALDVEQIGSVYETMMGFRLETATGRSVAIKAQKKQGAPTAVDLEALLAEPPSKREKWLRDRADRKLTATVTEPLKAVETLEDLHAVLAPVLDLAATPDLVPKGAMVLQPSEERRRSGSHYTPRALTEPIVRTTLEPILDRIKGSEGLPPRPEQILDLKVCDPAMGSGAFLVEACRQLGDALVESWHAHDEVPTIPSDEDEVIFARRLIAQRCLYGVDINPVAVDLAKMSLWLVTLAKDHALTFVDHALRHGDSLVGLSRRQLEAFHWDESKGAMLKGLGIRDALDRVATLRQKIRAADETVADWERRDLWDEAQFELNKVRLLGDLVVAAFFEGTRPKEREAKRGEYESWVLSGSGEMDREWLGLRRQKDRPFAPFHWEVEFQEVFDRENSGFDAIVGNPPFLGGTAISQQFGMPYFQWLTASFRSCQHHCDLVAYFFRRATQKLRDGGCFGLIATNTISQGDTREGGLRVILSEGSNIYQASRRIKWPGPAAVVVSVVHAIKNRRLDTATLDGVPVPRISAYLVAGSIDNSPTPLDRNPYFSLGSKIYGQGFLFADGDPDCTPLEERQRLLDVHPDWEKRIPPYLTGEEVNSNPRHSSARYVISLSDVSGEPGLSRWPELKNIVEKKVKPERLRLGSNPNNTPLKRRWWAYQAHRPHLYKMIADSERVLVISQVTSHLQFAFVPGQGVFSHGLVVLPLSTYSAFCTLQSRPHEIWARFFSSSMKDDLRYTPSDCFETFPFPERWEDRPDLEAAGHTYYEFRAALMIENDEGLTKTYNRFHDPEEHHPDIVKLRELHAAMDRAVLDAYGWTDIPTDCEFLLDYEIDEEEWSPRRKKPYRYRWPDEVHDEVLARLLELNAERAEEERRFGAARKARNRGAKGKQASKSVGSGRLF